MALADPVTQPEAFYAGLRLVTLDGGHFDLADERDNRAADFTPTMVPPMNVRSRKKKGKNYLNEQYWVRSCKPAANGTKRRIQFIARFRRELS